MNVGQLRKLLAGLPETMVVRVEVTAQDGDVFENADLHNAEVASRCDEIDALCLWGDRDEPQEAPRLKAAR